jgi:hypothetical protein
VSDVGLTSVLDWLGVDTTGCSLAWITMHRRQAHVKKKPFLPTPAHHTGIHAPLRLLQVPGLSAAAQHDPAPPWAHHTARCTIPLAAAAAGSQVPHGLQVSSDDSSRDNNMHMPEPAS